MRKLGVVALVVVGLLTILASGALLGTALSLGGMMQGRSLPGLRWLVFQLAAAAWLAAGGALLIWKRYRFAERWFEDSEAGATMSAVELLRVAVIVVGLALIISGVPSLLAAFASPSVYSLMEPPGAGIPLARVLTDLALRALVPLTELAFGLLLIAYSEALADRLWFRRPRRPASEQTGSGYACSACGAPFDPTDYRTDIAIARCVECKEPLDLGRVV